MNTPLRTLLVEDSPADAELVLRELRRAGYEPEWTRVETEPDYQAQLSHGWDLVLADYVLPQFSGLRAIELLRQRGLDTPIIIVSGTIGEDTAVAAMKAGANDYVMKGRLARLGPAVDRELRETLERQRRRHAEDELRLKHAEFEALFNDAPVGYHELDAEGRVTQVNRTELRMLGTRQRRWSVAVYGSSLKTRRRPSAPCWTNSREPLTWCRISSGRTAGRTVHECPYSSRIGYSAARMAPSPAYAPPCKTSLSARRRRWRCARAPRTSVRWPRPCRRSSGPPGKTDGTPTSINSGSTTRD